MEEKQTIGEQPSNLNSYSADAQISPNENSGATEKSEEVESKGSPYGKFRDATSLLSAYLSLQAEFTRKSQRLAELEKSNLSSDSLALPSKMSEEASENRDLPLYKKEGWKGKVAAFLKDNPEAKSEVSKISRILLNNKTIAKSDDCLMLAYKLALADKYKDPASLVSDEAFLENYILDNPRANELIISKYKNSLKNRPTAPAVITGQPTDLAKTPAKKLNTLSEAGEVLRKMFK